MCGTGWRADDVASSVEQFVPYDKLKRVQAGWEDGFDVPHD